jgi:maltose alpha-D-glucosyltransferase/alpha-amylase
LGPYTSFWFELIKQEQKLIDTLEKTPGINLKNSWEEIILPGNVTKLEMHILPRYVKKCRWFGGKARDIRSVKVMDTIILSDQNSPVILLIFTISYKLGNSESYLLPLSFIFKNEEKDIAREFPESVICRGSINEKDGFLYDGVYDQHVHQMLFNAIAKHRKIQSGNCSVAGKPGTAFKTIWGKNGELLPSAVFRTEQSNTSIVFGDIFFMKIFRRLESGINPDIEISRFLTEKGKYKNIPAFAGSIEIGHNIKDTMNICILQQYIPSESSAWSYTQDNIKSFFELVLTEINRFKKDNHKTGSVDASDNVSEGIENGVKINKVLDGLFLEMVQLLGQRTGEMHIKLSESAGNPDFKAESFSLLYQRSLYQSMGSNTRLVFELLKKIIPELPDSVRIDAENILNAKQNILSKMELIAKKKNSAKKIRIHGDYHLGQVLFTGKDFFIIDFEGEPAKAISERRLKRSSLRDIAGMLRSFHYAVNSILYLDKSIRKEDFALLETAADIWYSRVCDVFIESYFSSVASAGFLPDNKSELDMLLQIFLLDKSVYELGYELNNRPDWLIIPLRGISKVLHDFDMILSSEKGKEEQ